MEHLFSGRLSWSEDERAEVRAWLQPEQLKEVSPDELVLLVAWPEPFIALINL